MDDSVKLNWLVFRCEHFQSQQWVCYVTASWVPYHINTTRPGRGGIKTFTLCNASMAWALQPIYARVAAAYHHLPLQIIGNFTNGNASPQRYVQKTSQCQPVQRLTPHAHVPASLPTMFTCITRHINSCQKDIPLYYKGPSGYDTTAVTFPHRSPT